VKGLTEEQLQFARTDENTKFSTYPQIPKPAEPDHTASPQGGAAQNE
jgi:hypothetical protein